MQILGASGHAKVIINMLNLLNEKIDGVWDDNELLTVFLEFNISGKIADLRMSKNENAIIAIGNNKVRKEIAERVDMLFGIVSHPLCSIDESVYLGEGTVVMANATINASTEIGNHVIINTNASVDHDCKIANFVHISPQVGLAGNVEVGEGTHIGIGACVIQGVKIGKWATIGAGAVILKDVPDYAVVVGNPGKVIKFNTID